MRDVFNRFLVMLRIGVMAIHIPRRNEPECVMKIAATNT
jgi:hypothetical protein